MRNRWAPTGLLSAVCRLSCSWATEVVLAGRRDRKSRVSGLLDALPADEDTKLRGRASRPQAQDSWRILLALPGQSKGFWGPFLEARGPPLEPASRPTGAPLPSCVPP